jgi:FMN-dependent NADH-azoreductase
MKTLIVKYIPRNEQSNTKRLLDAFKDEINESNVEELDLLDDVSDMFLGDNLSAYIKRNFLGQKLFEKEGLPLSKMDTKDETIVPDWKFIRRQTKLEVFAN